MFMKSFFGLVSDDDCDLQSACELIRQHMDVGGVRNPSNYKWQQVT